MTKFESSSKNIEPDQKTQNPENPCIQRAVFQNNGLISCIIYLQDLDDHNTGLKKDHWTHEVASPSPHEVVIGD